MLWVTGIMGAGHLTIHEKRLIRETRFYHRQSVRHVRVNFCLEIIKINQENKRLKSRNFRSTIVNKYEIRLRVITT